MTVQYSIISIGALSHNRLWGERAPVRTAHATTTLIREGKRMILVDPSLPAPALAARFNERTGKSISDVTDVFCTTLRPVHRRSIEAFEQANWWVHEQELAHYRSHLEGLLETARRLGGEEAELAQTDLKLLDRFQPAPERFGQQVQLYPLAGASPGSAGLLLVPSTSTIVVAGDAAITGEHIRQGQVWAGCVDTQLALRCLRDLLELADVIIPGHDNILFAPGRWL